MQSTASEADKLAAIAVIRERSDQEARALLGSLPAESGARTSSAPASRAIAAIDPHLERWRQVQHLWYGISLGSRAAARRHRARHHLRRHGRHQHGARRDGDAGGLHHVRGAGGDPHQRAGAVRLFAGDCHPAGLPGRRPRRHRHRARRDPVPLRPAARDAARHLGHQPHPAAGGAHDLRPQQPRGRHAELHVGRGRARRARHHLEPAVRSSCSPASCSRRCWRRCATPRSGCTCAR